MHFDYLKTETYMDSIEIDDTGHCALKVTNDESRSWYLRINTYLGWSYITQIGPVETMENSILHTFFLSYNEMEYDSKKLYKIIKDFINDTRKNITQVELIELEEYDTIEEQIIRNWMTKQ